MITTNPFDDDKLREECGIFGVSSAETASAIVALGLHALQHRGQEAAGITSWDGHEFHTHRAMGHVAGNFDRDDVIRGLPGGSACGHVRYSTTGETSLRNVQPLYAELNSGGFAVAHNGNISNAMKLRRELIRRGSIFQSTSDTEVIIHLVATSSYRTLLDKFIDALKQVEGAYSLIVMTPEGMIACRDPLGIRPLVMGTLGDATIFASETVALDVVGADYVRTVEPGELVIVTNSGEIRSLRRLLPPAPATRSAYEEKIREQYGDLAEVFLALYPSDNIDESMLAATRDALYGWTAERLARKQTILGEDAYLYLFDHGYPAADKAGLHAFHASEIPYVFGTIHDTAPNWPSIPRKADERELSGAMMQYWTSFARDGLPTAHGQVDWPAYGPDANFMVFDAVPQTGKQLLGTRYALNEAVVCRRRAAGDQPWHWNVGIASPPLPPRAEGCQ